MIFHLAIPAQSLKDSARFYQSVGATIGRSYETHVVLNFFGQQVVLHQSEDCDLDPKMYPRHFGIILGSIDDLKRRYNVFRDKPYVFEEYFIRRRGCLDEHHTFFLKDPSNNLIEFKWYKNFSSVF